MIEKIRRSGEGVLMTPLIERELILHPSISKADFSIALHRWL